MLESIGAFYAIGQGLPRDFVEAHKWLNLAVAHYTAEEKEGRAKAVNVRDITALRMTPAQIAEAQRLASEWKPQR
jgi:TPR repeat protein